MIYSKTQLIIPSFGDARHRRAGADRQMARESTKCANQIKRVKPILSFNSAKVIALMIHYYI